MSNTEGGALILKLAPRQSAPTAYAVLDLAVGALTELKTANDELNAALCKEAARVDALEAALNRIASLDCAESATRDYCGACPACIAHDALNPGYFPKKP